MPGKKDVLSAADKNGAKIKKKRKWLLLDDISEFYKKYLKEYPENQIFQVKTPLGDSRKQTVSRSL